MTGSYDPVYYLACELVPMRVTMIVFLLMLTWPSNKVVAQDYSVTDIDCQYGGEAQAGIISARLRKPQGFQGVPIFADDRTIDPETSDVCSIRRNKNDVTGLVYNLNVTNFSSCGVVLRNGFVSLRIWFPKLRHVVMMSDQEVVIMCKMSSLSSPSPSPSSSCR